MSTLTWNVTPQLKDSAFVITSPEGAYEIEFAVYDDLKPKDTKQ